MKKTIRFEQLLALADDGDEAAHGDLFLEFGHLFTGSSVKPAEDLPRVSILSGSSECRLNRKKSRWKLSEIGLVN